MRHAHATDPASPVRIIAWETTRRCPLACRHCRAGARDHAYDGELSTDECLRLIDTIAAFAKPMIIFTGGEPMYREDLARLVRRATERGLRSVLAPCGLLVDEPRLRELREAGIQACSFSVDGATREAHDAFRGVDGAFDHILRAMDVARRIGMPFQINAAVSRLNAHTLPQIRDFALTQGATMLDCFFLVPVGRGKALADQALDPQTAEETLRWIEVANREGPLPLRVTCAPQSVRIWAQAAGGHAHHTGGGRPSGGPAGCMGGKSFVFVSHVGELQPCGFLDIPCGNVRDFDLDFGAAYRASEVFRALADPDRLKGGCGRCNHRATCGGCRARAYAATGDYLEAETTCPLAVR